MQNKEGKNTRAEGENQRKAAVEKKNAENTGVKPQEKIRLRARARALGGAMWNRKRRQIMRDEIIGDSREGA